MNVSAHNIRLSPGAVGNEGFKAKACILGGSLDSRLENRLEGGGSLKAEREIWLLFQKFR